MAKEEKAQEKKIEKKPEKKQDKTEKQEQKQKHTHEEENEDILVRILSYDIPGSKNIYTGLTRIKGISWTISKAICLKLNIPLNKKIKDMPKPEIQKIEDYLKNLDVPDFLKNRRADPETGKSQHLYSSDLDMKKEFDIKKLKEIKSYKGMRHALKLPVRGQRTRSHFRQKSQAAMMAKRKK